MCRAVSGAPTGRTAGRAGTCSACTTPASAATATAAGTARITAVGNNKVTSKMYLLFDFCIPNFIVYSVDQRLVRHYCM